jgi:hypothetical protein
MKSLTLFEGGYDKCVIRRHPDVFFGTKPTGEHLKFEIGLKLNGPAIQPFFIFDVWTLGFSPICTYELDKALAWYTERKTATLLSSGFRYGFKLHQSISKKHVYKYKELLNIPF